MPVRNADKSTHPIPRRSALSLGAATAAGIMAGCSGGTSDDSEAKIKKKINNPPDNMKKKGFPIVKQPVTLHFMTRRFVSNAKDFNKVANWKKYQSMTNIKVDWGLEPQESIDEKRNLALSSGDYPEAFNGCGFPVLDVGKYGSQGIFIKINDLIDRYMPNLKKLMDEIPGIKQGMTFPGGDIYSMPTIWDPDFTGMHNYYRFWIRGDWLDKLDMDVPRTTDEYHTFLKACKKREGAYGYCDVNNLGNLRWGLAGSFGIANRGMSHSYLDADPQDETKVRFYRIADEYKALLEYLHKLYRDGLIAKDALSIEGSKFRSNLPKGVYSSTVDFLPSNFGAKGFTPIQALQGPEHRHDWTAVQSGLHSIGEFVITDRCKHPVETARWMDYFYSKEGARLFFLGVKGKSWTETKNGPQYIEKINHPPDGVSVDDVMKPYVTFNGGPYPGFITEGSYVGNSGTSKTAVRAARKVADDSLEKVWPAFTFSQDENEQLKSLSDDIEKYADESYGRFISGDLSLSKWDKYVEKIKQMGLDDYLQIQQAAYDRYRKHR